MQIVVNDLELTEEKGELLQFDRLNLTWEYGVHYWRVAIYMYIEVFPIEFITLTY